MAHWQRPGIEPKAISCGAGELKICSKKVKRKGHKLQRVQIKKQLFDQSEERRAVQAISIKGVRELSAGSDWGQN